MLPDRGCSQAAHTPPPPTCGQGFPPSSADSRTWANPAYGPSALQRKLILTVSPHSSALPDSPPSIPHPQIPVREPWDPALRVSGLPASCPRPWAKPKALPKASKWTPVSSRRRAQRPAQSTGPLTLWTLWPRQAGAGELRFLPAQEGQASRGSRHVHIHPERGPGSLLPRPSATLPSQDHTATSHRPLGIPKPREEASAAQGGPRPSAEATGGVPDAG